MGRLEDPNFKYISEEDSKKPGYLAQRMKLYKQMVEKESSGVSSSRKIHSGTKETSNRKADSGVLLDLTELRQRTVQNSGKGKR